MTLSFAERFQLSLAIKARIRELEEIKDLMTSQTTLDEWESQIATCKSALAELQKDQP